MWRRLIVGIFCAFAVTANAQVSSLISTAEREALLSFDHVLSIYEWHGLFDYSPSDWRDRSLAPSFDIHLRGNSRFLTLDSLTTTDATGSITAVQPLARFENDSWSLAPFVTLAGNSYVTTPRPGKLVGSIITKQASGYGVGGIRLTAPDRSAISASIGLTHQTQAAFSNGQTDFTGGQSLTATGLMFRS